jgi:hypothetical protein
MIDEAFLRLAKRLGNPIADRPDVQAAFAFLHLMRSHRASRFDRFLLNVFSRLSRLPAN